MSSKGGKNFVDVSLREREQDEQSVASTRVSHAEPSIQESPLSEYEPSYPEPSYSEPRRQTTLRPELTTTWSQASIQAASPETLHNITRLSFIDHYVPPPPPVLPITEPDAQSIRSVRPPQRTGTNLIKKSFQNSLKKKKPGKAAPTPFATIDEHSNAIQPPLPAEKKGGPPPDDTANIFSKITFGWIHPLMKASRLILLPSYEMPP